MSNAPLWQPQRIAIIAAISFVGANLAFYVLSGSYFDSHHQVVPGAGTMPSFSPEQVMNIRLSFAMFAGVCGVLGFFAAILPRATGHLLPLVLAALQLAGAVGAFVHNTPAVLWTTLAISGVLIPVLSWQSYFRKSRAAWAFLVTICGVFAVAEFFGAPKTRGALGISLWITMILPGLNAVAAATLWSLRDEYIERESVAS